MNDMNKWLLVVAGVLAIIGLVVNLAYDLDNVYDMTTVTLWVVTVILLYLGVYTGKKQ
jgi:hypothetical protein